MGITTGEKDRFEELRPSFHRWLGIFGTAVIVAVICAAVAYEPDPFISVGRLGWLVIGVGGAISFAGFALVAGMLVGEWLFERYSDTRKR